jgi:competence protein ComEC
MVPDVMPGEVWRMALMLSTPRGASNPFASDREGQMFARGIRATGIVRGKPVRLRDTPLATFETAIARLRYRLRSAMRAHLGNADYSGVIVALALGDQSGIGGEQWRLFSRTGITHLVAISGLHIGLIAGLAGTFMNMLWRRLRWRGIVVGERVPAQIAAAVVALGAAWGYCLLAGWGIPARRTFFTLLVMAAAVIFRLPLSGSRVLVMAGAFVTIIDPWAPVSRGFWLSFAAVAWLAQLGRATPRRWESPDVSRRSIRLRRVVNGLRLQWSLTAALTPPLAYLVNTVSLGSPFANVVAIPVVGMIVTPAALLGAALSTVPGCGAAAAALLHAANAVFTVLLVPVRWLATASWASVNVAAAPEWLLVLAMAGVVVAVQPRGLPFARLGWLLMVPMLCWRPVRPASGDWTMTALDVGQGSAVVVETAHHVLVFDTGPRSMSGADAGEKIVWPFLRAKGYRAVDVLVVSHADLDHVGGLRSVLSELPIAVSYASFGLSAYLRHERIQLERAASATEVHANPLPKLALPGEVLRCARGVAWEQDGVRFEFLHPFDSRIEPGVGQRNAYSCVLRVQGKHHSLLLTADIESGQEHALVASAQPTDLVMAAHHGSRTSSTPAWVNAVAPSHVFAQMGYRNHFGHPAAAVQQRWLRAGSYFWRTDLDGAILAQSDSTGLTLRAQRDLGRRYWHKDD